MLPTCLKQNSIAGEKWEKFVTTVLCAHISLDKIYLLGFWGNRIFPVVFFLFFNDSIFHSRTFIVETNVPTEGETVFSWKWGVFPRMKERLFDFNTGYVILSHPHLRSFEKAEFWRVQNMPTGAVKSKQCSIPMCAIWNGYDVPEESMTASKSEGVIVFLLITFLYETKITVIRHETMACDKTLQSYIIKIFSWN